MDGAGVDGFYLETPALKFLKKMEKEYFKNEKNYPIVNYIEDDEDIFNLDEELYIFDIDDDFFDD